MKALHRIAGEEVALHGVPYGMAGPLAEVGIATVSASEATRLVPPAGARRIFAGRVPLGDRELHLACLRGDGSYSLEIEKTGRFEISADGRALDFRGAPPGDLSADDFRTAVLGPVVTLALALRGVFCLHASAVLSPHGAVAFVGASGAGKSTLARLLVELGDQRWPLAADDILPWRVRDGRPEILPGFPQLKLDPADQPSGSLPESLPWTAVYTISAEPRPGSSEVRIEPLRGRSAALTLIARTVASRLFDHDLLARHLGSVAEATAKVRVGALGYPRELGVGSLVRSAVLADLESRNV